MGCQARALSSITSVDVSRKDRNGFARAEWRSSGPVLTMTKSIIQTDRLMRPIAHFSFGVRVANEILIGATAGTDTSIRLAGATAGLTDMQAQAERMFANFAISFDVLGGRMEDVAYVKSYITDWRDAPVYREAFKKFFGPRHPVHSLVLSAGFPLPQATVEAEMIMQFGTPMRRFAVAGPFDDAGRLLGGADPVAQTGHALEALARTLSIEGQSLRDVVMMRMTLADIRDLGAIEHVYQRVFAPPFPARTVVGAALAHPDQLIELDAIVVKGGGAPVGVARDTLGCASHAMLAGDYLYLSGQHAPTGATVEAQTRLAWEQINALLAMANMNSEDVIHTTNVLTDWRSYGGFNAGYGAHAHPPYPPRATVLGGLAEPRALVQIEAVAHRHGRDATFINVPGAS